MQLREVWTDICDRLAAYGHLDRSQFDLVEGLLAAGFKSKQQSIVDKTIETWNVVAKDEENVECSDSLKSIVSSVRSRPEEVDEAAADQSTGGFGAQATSYPGSHTNNHTIVLSTGTSHETSNAAPEPTVSSEKPQSSKRKRRAEAELTPEPRTARASKRKSGRSSRTSTPKLRHDNSQIQFQPIAASSSPMPEESQHLTEHQQETRDKQKNNAALYPEMRTSSPAADVEVSVAEEKEPEKTEEEQANRQTTPVRNTPERKTTYGELISSTPTPRRGQILMLEGASDPPSSPPEPRSNPLASQIQSRSKANTSMEDWDFSSPPASPVTSRQQVAQDDELPQVTLTNESPVPAASTNNGKTSQKNAQKDPTPSPDVIPSSLPPVAPPTTRSTRARSRAARSEPAPFTPPPKQKRPAAPVEPSSSRDQEDDFVDAKSNQEPSSPVLPDLPLAHEDPMDTSYTFSQVADDSQLANLVVEFEKRDEKLPKLPLTVVPSSSPSKQPADPRALEYAAGQPANSREEEKQSQEQEPPSSIVGDESVVEGTQGGKTKKKRKRVSRLGPQRKKRRSTEPSSSQPERVEEPQPEEHQEPEPPAQDSQASQVSAKHARTKPQPKTRAKSTRRSARVQAKEQEAEEPEAPEEQQAEPEAQPEEEEQVEKVQPTMEEENNEEDIPRSPGQDTDDEIMSQLHEESFAASESQRASRECSAAEGPSAMDESMDIGPTSDQPIVIDEIDEIVEETQHHEEEAEAQPEEEPAPISKSEAIIARLRNGMEDLRSASLSRDEFNKIEDMLFDMKRELFEAERRGRQ